jgi:predicted esterase
MRLLSSMTLSAGIKVLALHGKGGSGPAMARNLQPLVEATKADNWAWSFPSAPHSLEAFTAQGNVKQTTFKTGTAWWQLPPGVRSFEASEFEGVEESLRALEKRWEEEGPFDVLVGHSQGAMLTAIVVAQALSGKSGSSPLKPRCAILSGAAWPNPFGELCESLSSREGAPSSGAGAGAEGTTIPTLHCWGTEDTMNPPEQAQRLKGCFPQSEGLEHDGGHVVPLDSESIETMRKFVAASVGAAAASAPAEPEFVPWEGGLGGDPCSSPYNTDPFDEQEDKPDAWEEMKKRIQAKVDAVS